jgi:hypothetical protein
MNIIIVSFLVILVLAIGVGWCYGKYIKDWYKSNREIGGPALAIIDVSTWFSIIVSVLTVLCVVLGRILSEMDKDMPEIIRVIKGDVGLTVTCFVFVVSAFARLFVFLHKKTHNTHKTIKDDLDGYRDEFRSMVDEKYENISAFETVSKFYPQLIPGSILKEILENQYGGFWSEGDDASFSLSASNSKYHVSIHSEVLYYGILCELLISQKERIENVLRSHVLVPNSPSFLFISHIVDTLSSLETEEHNAYYFVRNDILDYNRTSMRSDANDREKERYRHLWNEFSDISRLFFRDENAKYGYLRAESEVHEDIWYGDDIRDKYIEGNQYKIERVRCKLAESGNIISSYVKRSSNYKFKSGHFILHSDSPDSELFQDLSDLTRWHDTDHWENYPVEVALVSSTELEEKASEGITFRAIDDFEAEEEHGGGWLTPGSPREIVWRQSKISTFRDASIERIFLVDPEKLEPDSDESYIVQLFVTAAIQHQFLESRDGEVRILVKEDKHKMEYNGLEPAFPDFSVITNARESIIGGVSLKPVTKFIKNDDQEFKSHLSSVWDESCKFPDFFTGHADTIKSFMNDAPLDMEHSLVECFEGRQDVDIEDTSTWINSMLETSE